MFICDIIFFLQTFTYSAFSFHSFKGCLFLILLFFSTNIQHFPASHLFSFFFFVLSCLWFLFFSFFLFTPFNFFFLSFFLLNMQPFSKRDWPNTGADPGFSFFFFFFFGGRGTQKVMCQHAHYERETELTFGRGPRLKVPGSYWVVLMLSRAI